MLNITHIESSRSEHLDFTSSPITKRFELSEDEAKAISLMRKFKDAADMTLIIELLQKVLEARKSKELFICRFLDRKE